MKSVKSREKRGCLDHRSSSAAKAKFATELQKCRSWHNISNNGSVSDTTRQWINVSNKHIHAVLTNSCPFSTNCRYLLLVSEWQFGETGCALGLPIKIATTGKHIYSYKYTSTSLSKANFVSVHKWLLPNQGTKECACWARFSNWQYQQTKREKGQKCTGLKSKKKT